MTGRAGSQILRHTLGCPSGYRELALLARPMHWAPQCAWILTKALRRLRERPQPRELPFIVRDESRRVFLGVALQQTPPLRRPSSIVSQVRISVNRKLRRTGLGPVRSRPL